jgi:hypothetical protein
MHRKIDIHNVSKIERVILKSQADMFLYEVYYINKLRPPLNVDDKAYEDRLTVSLPELNFELYECHLIEKWKEKL